MTREEFDNIAQYYERRKTYTEAIEEYKEALKSLEYYRNTDVKLEVQLALDSSLHITAGDLREFVEAKIAQLKNEIDEIDKKIEEL